MPRSYWDLFQEAAAEVQAAGISTEAICAAAAKRRGELNGAGIERQIDAIVDDLKPGDRGAFVAWGGATGVQNYPEGQLRVVEDLAGQFASAGPGATVPFQLRVLGRWFEARHDQTGEITNQPFDMLPHQVIVTNRMLTSPPAEDGGRHWLIADDVGLGKTIEAGGSVSV